MSNKPEYDEAIGGSVRLERHIPTYRYAASAVNEIKQLIDEVRNPTGRKLVFQTLPKHMRRRAMSHHPKRLPRKYRSAHRAQMAKAGKPQQHKRPSRKHRRRPKNLLSEYIRRQRKHVWLETHIWHARRFHMVERWGYKLAYSSCDKTYRACYRATAQHCLLQDISFYACIQLEAPLEELIIGFHELTSCRLGLGIAAKTFLTGRREGSIDLFEANKFPEGALGRATFMWQPLTEKEEAAHAVRTLWLWVHPSGYKKVLEQLIVVFGLSPTRTVKVMLKPGEVVGVKELLGSDRSETTDETATESESQEEIATPSSEGKKVKVKEERELKFMTKTLAYERIRRYENKDRGIMLSELKDTMNRFRLTGPLAQSVLAKALKVKDFSFTRYPDWLQMESIERPWLVESHNVQAAYWRKCQGLSSPAELMSNMIIGLNIEDPRLNRPQKRSKALPNPDDNESKDILTEVPPSCLSVSGLWYMDTRDYIIKQTMTTQKYGELRNMHAVVPGGACEFEKHMQPVPVLLIQRPGSQDPNYKRLGYGCGWDVIIPAGYGMPVWMALIMWGAKPGGLREIDSLAREMGTEVHLPDTLPGRLLAGERKEELKNHYFRRPPNRRRNYTKLGIISPFSAPFGALLRDWSEARKPKISSFHVLRDRAALQEWQTYVHKMGTIELPRLISIKCLLQVQLRLKSRGSLQDFALICLPTAADFKCHLRQIKRNKHDPIYTEPLYKDEHEKLRKSLRLKHMKYLRKMRRDRAHQRRYMTAEMRRLPIESMSTATAVTAHFKRMSELWLPEYVSIHGSVRRQCSREVFGYVTSTNFSYTEGCVCAIGYVVLPGLMQLMALCREQKLRQPMCLVRSPTSRHYRFATFKLNLDV